MCVCVFCVLVIHYEGAGEKRLMKAAQSSRLESPLPACVSHQLLTSRADSPLWWVWFSLEKASARRQRFVFRAATKQARQPRRAPPQAWAGQLQRRLQPCLQRECGPQGVPSSTAPFPNALRCPVQTRLCTDSHEHPFLALLQLATVAETAMAITRINSVFVGQKAEAPPVTQITDSMAPPFSPAPFFFLPPSFPSSVSCAHATCLVSHGISQLQLPREQ